MYPPFILILPHINICYKLKACTLLFIVMAISETTFFSAFHIILEKNIYINGRQTTISETIMAVTEV
jgi:hypothetical protein